MKQFKLFLLVLFIILSATIVSGAQRHVVKEGESIIDVAAMYDTTPLELAVANNLDLNSPLEAGQKLIIVKMAEEEIINNITVPEVHKVTKGETLYSIAKKYGVSVATLASINHIKANAKLVQGRIIKIITPAEEIVTNFEKNMVRVEKGNQTLVTYAMGLKGIPYVSGGSSRGGFDCSGFTSYVYAQFGKKIPRNSQSQYRGGKKVALNDLQKGDIVCFTTRRGGCSHVGIYIGNNKFIHAANKNKGVVVSSMSEKYYSSRYLGARRY